MHWGLALLAGIRAARLLPRLTLFAGQSAGIAAAQALRHGSRRHDRRCNRPQRWQSRAAPLASDRNRRRRPIYPRSACLCHRAQVGRHKPRCQGLPFRSYAEGNRRRGGRAFRRIRHLGGGRAHAFRARTGQRLASAAGVYPAPAFGPRPGELFRAGQGHARHGALGAPRGLAIELSWPLGRTSPSPLPRNAGAKARSGRGIFRPQVPL